MAQQMLTAMVAAQGSSPGQSTQQQHATPRIKVKGRRRVKSRTSYSLSLKLRAVEEAERSGLRAAAVTLQLDERVLRQWVTKAEELRRAGLTNAGSTRRLRSRSTSMGKLAVAGSEDEVQDPSPTPPALPTGNMVGNRNVSLLAVTPPSAGLVTNGVHNLHSSPSADESPSYCSTSSSSLLVISRADACVGTCSASTMTEPEFLGPCEPGTAVSLDGTVWHENEGGILVVNVAWRGKTFVGTLMDSTKSDWAPPRFFDSPLSDADHRGLKGRPRRTRGATSTPVQANGVAASFKGRRSFGGPPPSPAKEAATSGGKRKGNITSKNADDSANVSASKRSCSSSRGAGCSSPSMEPPASSTAASPVLIECPEPNCSKKFRNVNGLKYHQSHVHERFTSGAGEESMESTCNYGENSITKNGSEQLFQLEEPVAPFTGKVPPPPEASSTPVNVALPGVASQKPLKPNSLRLPEPNLVFLPASSSTPSSIPTDDGSYNGSNNATIEHLFTPILDEPSLAATPSVNWTTLKPNSSSVTSKSIELDVESVNVKQHSKHKKKNKDKDCEKKYDSSKKTSGDPVLPAVVTNLPIGEGSSVVHSITSAPVISEPATADLNHENVQSPAYSDISDANDPSPSLLDDERKKVAEKMANETVLPSVAGPTGPGVHPTLGVFGMYPFFGHQSPYTQPTSNQPATNTGEMPEDGKVHSLEPALQSQLPAAPTTAYGFVSTFSTDAAPIADSTLTTIKMSHQVKSSPVCKEKMKRAPIGTSNTPILPASDQSLASTGGIQKGEMKKSGTAIAANKSPSYLQASESASVDPIGQQHEGRFYSAYNAEDSMLGPGSAFGNRFQSPMNSSAVGSPSGTGWMTNGVKVSQRDIHQQTSQQQMMQQQMHMQQRQQVHHHQLQQQFQQQLQHQLQQQHQQHMLLQQQHFQQQQRKSTFKQAPSASSSAPSPKVRPASADRKPEQPKVPDGVKPAMESQGQQPLSGMSPYGVLPNIHSMHVYGLPFDPSHPAYRNNMTTMMGGAPYPFSPSPGTGVSPVDMSPGMRYGTGFPGPSGEDLNRTNALEILQHHANQYYSTAQPSSLPPTTQGGTPTGTSQQFQSQRLVHERVMTQSSAVGYDPSSTQKSTTPTGSLQPSQQVISGHRYPSSS